MGVGAGLYMCDVVKKFTFAISSPDEFLYCTAVGRVVRTARLADLSARPEEVDFLLHRSGHRADTGHMPG